MATELRKTGISVVGDIPWGAHFCSFYNSKEDLLDILVPYFKTGLENNEFCLWVISNSELLTVQEATSALRSAIPDFDWYVAGRSLEVVGHDEWFLVDGVFDLHRVANRFKEKLDEALHRGYAGMRVNGSPAWLQPTRAKELREFEEQVDDLFPNLRILASCTYPLGTISGDQIFNTVHTHQFAIARRQGQWEVIETPELMQARAEIKRLNEELQKVTKRTPKSSVILRYGLAVLSVAAALIITLWMRMEIGQPSTPIVGLFLCAVMFSAWFGGVRPGLLAIALSLLAFDYYFVPPIYSLSVEIKEIPRLLVFALSALFVGSLSAAQRNATESLRRARDVLDETVQELRRSNQALRTENAERKHAEALLYAKEQEFRAIVENAPDQIIRYDREFRRVYINPAVAKAYGLPVEALIGKPIGAVIQDAAPDIKGDDVAKIRQRIAAVFSTGESSEFELTWSFPTGQNHLSVRFFPELDLNGAVINVLGISRDITERKLAEERIRATSEQLRALSAKLQSAKEEEDIRIAREIHDEMGSTLTSLRWELERFDKTISEAEDWSQLQALRAKIADMMRLTDITIGTMRRIASELRPSILDDLGLAEAIEWQTQQFQTRTGIVCRCDCSLENLDFDPEQSTAIFRIFQEALTNILGHARATRVEVGAGEDDGEFVLTISDNGRGITEDEKSDRLSLGILGMRERAHLIGGELEITGIEGRGTVVTVRMPTPGKSKSRKSKV